MSWLTAVKSLDVQTREARQFTMGTIQKEQAMKRITSTLAYAAVILATSQSHAATVKLDAFAYDTRNT
jgi:hypothetical protein